MAFESLGWILGIICAIWVIYDVATKQKKMKSTQRVLWIIAALLFSIITAVVYYLVVKKK